MKKDKAWLKEEVKKVSNNYPTYHDERDDLIKKMINMHEVLNLIGQLYEPELSVIPQFVADWIEDHEHLGDTSKIRVLWYAIHEADRTIGVEMLDYFNQNARKVMRAILDGYTIEPQPIKTRQVLVKFFDNEEYKTELTEDAARELIEFLEANKNE